MDVIEGIETRRSIRGFKDTPVPEETVNKILQAAANSPSYKNSQPWEVAVVCGKKRDDLSELLCDLVEKKSETRPDLPQPKGWPPAHEALTREHGSRRFASLGITRDDDPARAKLGALNFSFYGGPCAVFLFMDGSLGEWSIFDMGLFTQNLILAAHSFGLGTCLQASVPNYSPEIKRFLGMDEGKKLVICISMGYPDQGAKLNVYRAIKQRPDEFTNWYR